MDSATVLSLVKARLGISTTVRDTYLTAIINGVLQELSEEKGLVLSDTDPNHLIFVVDYAAWRYQSRDKDTGMPRHLQYRLHCMYFHIGAGNPRVDSVLSVDTLPASPADYIVYITPDGSKQIYLDGAWTTVDLVDGVWVVAV